MRARLNRSLGYPRFKLRWLRMLAYRRFLDWYRRSHFCRSTGSGMLTPLEATFRLLELKGLYPQPMIALEVFGGTGLFKAVDLAPRCEQLTFIELSDAILHHARKVVPAERTVFLSGDSIELVRSGRLPRKDYNLVHVDNDFTPQGEGYCENFDLFPGVLDCLAPRAVLVLNVQLDIRGRDPDAFWLRRRGEFFGTPAADAARVDYETARRAYLARVPGDRFEVAESFAVPHHGETIYLVLCLTRKPTCTPAN